MRTWDEIIAEKRKREALSQTVKIPKNVRIKPKENPMDFYNKEAYEVVQDIEKQVRDIFKKALSALPNTKL
jgi:hypothetical protein